MIGILCNPDPSFLYTIPQDLPRSFVTSPLYRNENYMRVASTFKVLRCMNKNGSVVGGPGIKLNWFLEMNISLPLLRWKQDDTDLDTCMEMISWEDKCEKFGFWFCLNSGTQFEGPLCWMLVIMGSMKISCKLWVHGSSVGLYCSASIHAPYIFLSWLAANYLINLL